jgi:hypothetical protein
MEEKKSRQKNKKRTERVVGPDHLLRSWPPELKDDYLGMSPEERGENFASPKRAAPILGRSEGTIRNWCDDGTLHYVRLHDRWLIDVRPYKRRSQGLTML